MYSSRKTLKAVLVFVLAVVLLSNAVLPITVIGSNNDTNVDYQYYAVKSGDTLTKIAKNYGVTISDIMSANNLSNADRIVAGKVIKVPLSSSSASGASLVSTRISLNLVEANIKDALSAIALNAGYTVIFVSDSENELTVNLDQMTALKAIDYVTRLSDLTYLKDGNTIMVGTAAELNNKFVDKVVMSKFTLNYITVSALEAQASALGLSDVQYVTTEQNDSLVYVSAYPKELAKIQELIKILDVSSNIMSGSALITSNFTSIDLTNITASEFSGLLSNLGLDAGIVLASRPYTLYTFVTGAALADIKTIKNIVDKPLTGANLSATVTEGATSGDQVVTTPPVTDAPTTVTNPAGGGTSGGTVTPTENTILREVSLAFIDRAEAVSILNSFPYAVTVYGPEKMTKKLWLLGTEAEVNNAQNKLGEFDTQEYLDSVKLENQFFQYDLKNYTADEMLLRLANITLEGVTFMKNSYSSVSKSLLVFCDYAKQDQVKSLLDKMDTTTTAEEEYRVVEKTANAVIAQSRIATIRALHPEIPAAAEFEYKMVADKAGTEQCVTWVRAKAETVDYIKALLAEVDAG